MLDYETFITYIKDRLAECLSAEAAHNLDEKNIASACRDYAEALRALEQAKLNRRKGE